MWGQPFYSSHPVVCHTLNGAPDATASPPPRYALRAPLRGDEPVIPGPQQAQTKLHGRFRLLGVNTHMTTTRTTDTNTISQYAWGNSR
jgi:hypothetical protein